uniref:OSK domain-containing protein n=1 Tax=Timema douglasi TaxID=61478 RepID=A0A7R8VYL2_TIMDO|nr:unnamed protein product [Timema douglasi]
MGESGPELLIQPLLPGESDLPYTGCVQDVLQIGLCVSGQKLAQLLRRLYCVLLGGRPLNDQVILMIGVNDLLNQMPCGSLTFMAYFSLTMET